MPTAKQIQQFDFSNIDEEKAIRYIENAIIILKELLPHQILLFHEGLL